MWTIECRSLLFAEGAGKRGIVHVGPSTQLTGFATSMIGLCQETSMIGLCQETKGSPDALGRSAGVDSFSSPARRVGLSAAVPIRE
jgi:hypothetical protein